LATTANLTGALLCDTLLPERSFPVKVPSATTPRAVARKLVIFAAKESLGDLATTVDDFALAGGATTAARASVEKPAMTSLRIVSSLTG
jgi:hypothetical protein